MPKQSSIREEVATATAGMTAAQMASAYFQHDAQVRVGQTAPQIEKDLPRAKTLNHGEIHSLKHYGSEDGPLVNRYMRDNSVRVLGKSTSTRINVRVATPDEQVKREPVLRRTSTDVGRVLNRTEMKPGTTLYRGMGTAHIPGGMKPGTVVGDAGVMSTATDIKSATGFHGMAQRAGKKPVLMVIDAGGAKGALMAENAQFKAEREVALAPGTKATVTRIEKDVKRGLFDKPKTYAMATTKSDAVIGGTRGTGTSGRVAGVAGKLGTGLAVAAPVVAAVNAYNAATASGMDQNDAVRLGAGAGVVTGAAAAGIAAVAKGAAKLALRVAPKLAPALGPAGLALGLGMTAYGAYQGYQNTGTLAGAAKGAIGLDTAPPPGSDPTTIALAEMQQRQIAANPAAAGVDLAKRAAKPGGSISKLPGKANAKADANKSDAKPGSAPSAGAQLSLAHAKSFEQANAEFSAGRAQASQQAEAQQGDGQGQAMGGPRGFANPNVQFAAQNARGVQNFSDWAESGKK